MVHFPCRTSVQTFIRKLYIVSDIDPRKTFLYPNCTRKGRESSQEFEKSTQNPGEDSDPFGHLGKNFLTKIYVFYFIRLNVSFC